MLSDVEKGSNLMLTRLTPVATLIDTKQQSATTCFSTQTVTFSCYLCNRRDARVERHIHAKRTIHWATNFWSCFFYFYFVVFHDVFWCAESENDVSFFVVSAVFL